MNWMKEIGVRIVRDELSSERNSFWSLLFVSVLPPICKLLAKLSESTAPLTPDPPQHSGF